MNIVDSSGWLEYIAHSSRASFFASAIEDTTNLAVPTIVLYEVFKKILQERGEQDALRVIAHMHLATMIDIDSSIALAAARISVAQRLPMADSFIFAASRRYGAILWTQDADMKDLPGVKYFSKKKA